ncbi:MAG: hypothetical protein M3069_19475 [Chloroflexota bacterium]|nr:hypothetical protein [Chloroflexota bacterium]
MSCVPAFGHLNPLLPLAKALADAGHAVAIATGSELRPRAEAAGFTTFSVGRPLSDAFDELSRRFPDRIYERLAPVEIVPWYLPHLFGESIAPATLEDLQTVVRSWRPDLVVHDIAELAAPIAAAHAGIPNVSHTLGLRFEGELLELIGAAIAPLWRQHVLQADPAAGLYRHLCLDTMPASWQTDPSPPYADVIRPLRPVAPPPIDGERLPTWMATRHRVPLVYMTLGTWTNSNVSIFRSVVDGLADVDVEVLLTVGPGNDPGAIGALPHNAHVEEHVLQSLLLPRCEVVICHGGAGTTLGSLALGLPLLVLPQGADQYIISERLISSGAGICLRPADVNPDSVRLHVLSLLNDPRYRAAAQRMQREIGAMPGPEQIVPLVEDLAGVGSQLFPVNGAVVR